MSRSGYTDDADNDWCWIRWRGAVASAMRGKRGQEFLQEMLDALDALPQKRLISYDVEKDGEVCAIGAVGYKRGVSMEDIDPENREGIAGAFGIAEAMAAEIMYENDEVAYWDETPEHRFSRMRHWIASLIRTKETASKF